MKSQFEHHPDLFEAAKKFKSRWHVKDKWQLFLICPYEQKAVYNIWNKSQDYQDVKSKERMDNSTFPPTDHELNEVVNCNTHSEKEKGDDQVSETSVWPDLSFCPIFRIDSLS